VIQGIQELSGRTLSFHIPTGHDRELVRLMIYRSASISKKAFGLKTNTLLFKRDQNAISTRGKVYAIKYVAKCLYFSYITFILFISVFPLLYVLLLERHSVVDASYKLFSSAVGN
jgi:hypothetical protein